MTTEEFKKLKPKYKDIEGNELWDAMTEYMIQQQCVKKPIWERYTLRWLFYRKAPSFKIHTLKEYHHISDDRCKECKKGVNARMTHYLPSNDGTYKAVSYCPYCSKPYIEEPNTNLSHKIYKLGKWFEVIFWSTLDFLHIVRNSPHQRYDMFGDEALYVEHLVVNMETFKMKRVLKSRKWWEYIFIKKNKIQ